jgi:hypothetical protein
VGQSRETGRAKLWTITDGRVVEKIEGLKNTPAVAVDSNDAMYVGEANGTDARKVHNFRPSVKSSRGAVSVLRSWRRTRQTSGAIGAVDPKSTDAAIVLDMRRFVGHS